MIRYCLPFFRPPSCPWKVSCKTHGVLGWWGSYWQAKATLNAHREVYDK